MSDQPNTRDLIDAADALTRREYAASILAAHRKSAMILDPSAAANCYSTAKLAAELGISEAALLDKLAASRTKFFRATGSTQLLIDHRVAGVLLLTEAAKTNQETKR